MDDISLKNYISEMEVKDAAQANTILSEKTGAEIKNAFVQGATEGMKAVGSSMVDAFKEKLDRMLSGAEIQMKNGSIRFSETKSKTNK